jgi:hypothetical protein
MAAEADAVSLALAEGRAEIPEMTLADTSTIARLLASWFNGVERTHPAVSGPSASADSLVRASIFCQALSSPAVTSMPVMPACT